MSTARRSEILEANEELAGRALRTLGIAYRDLEAGALADDAVSERVERDLVFAGLIGIIDPPRDEARAAVALAKTAGIRPLMITGIGRPASCPDDGVHHADTVSARQRSHCRCS